jgi:hypothetical protein
VAAGNPFKPTLNQGAEFHLEELDTKLTSLQANLALLSQLVETTLPSPPIRASQGRNQNAKRAEVICISTRRPVR